MKTFRMRPAVSDAGWAGVLAVALTTLILGVPEGPDTAVEIAAALACAAAQAASILLMRRWPEPAMGLAIVAGIGIEALAPQVGWLGLAAAPLISFARIRPPRVSLCALGVMLALTPWTFVSGGWTDLILAVFASLLGWAWGELARVRCIRREQERRRIVSDERARLARELHDVVAHNVSLMVVQAGAAADVFDSRPDRARAALDTIQEAGRSALGELRTMLQTLRPDGVEPRAPQPGLDQLDALAASLGAAGLAVAVNSAGDARAVPADVSLSAYRIVQESLTNTLRHARATRAEVDLRWTDAALHLQITDDGAAAAVRAPHAHGAGAGLVGMRERARLVGGSLDAGPLPAGGFRVSARLPLGASA
ncbi:histidine kinase [Actinoplanes sp. NPDC026623]|uniref:sensor histidine kinase n=1 Tax=Actinoplanes sp. NPDC026623 TaxID=3155610 RepID=UPI0033FED409